MVDLLKRVNELEYLTEEQSKCILLQDDRILKLERKVNSLEGQLMVVNSQFAVRDHVIEGLQGYNSTPVAIQSR